MSTSVLSPHDAVEALNFLVTEALGTDATQFKFMDEPTRYAHNDVQRSGPPERADVLGSPEQGADAGPPKEPSE